MSGALCPSSPGFTQTLGQPHFKLLLGTFKSEHTHPTIGDMRFFWHQVIGFGDLFVASLGPPAGP